MQSSISKYCVITGATSGLGRAAAIALAKQGAFIFVVGRNPCRGRAVVDRIKTDRCGDAQFIACDLSDQRQVESLARTIKHASPRIDILINDAGADFPEFQLSADGVEKTFATNHIGHFLLTALLLEWMQKAGEARIVNVAGDAHFGIEATFDLCMTQAAYNRKTAKKQAKLANVVFTYALADRLSGTAITVNAMHPGGVASRWGMSNGLSSWLKHIVYHALTRNLVSAKTGADTIVFLATHPAVHTVTGGYFFRRKPHASSAQSLDKAAAKRLWDISLRMTDMDERIGAAWRFFKP